MRNAAVDRGLVKVTQEARIPGLEPKCSLGRYQSFFSLGGTGRNQVGELYALGTTESPTVNSKGHRICENVKQHGRARFLSYAILARVIYRIFWLLSFLPIYFSSQFKEKKIPQNKIFMV